MYVLLYLHLNIIYRYIYRLYIDISTAYDEYFAYMVSIILIQIVLFNYSKISIIVES